MSAVPAGTCLIHGSFVGPICPTCCTAATIHGLNKFAPVNVSPCFVNCRGSAHHDGPCKVGVAASERERALEGLPPDLVRILSDPSIRIDHPGLRDLDLALYVYDNVPSDTASAMTVDDWKKAWMEAWQRANRAEMALDEIRELLDEARKTEERLRG